MPASATRSDVPRYAVIFRTHFWDAFCDRQFKRLAERIEHGDLYVLVDETRGHVAGIPTERVFPVTDQQILDTGFVAAGEGSIQWFSGDVPLYLFRHAHPDYDYYVQIEYDVNVHLSFDRLIERVRADGADIVALERRATNEDWHWMHTIRGVYSEAEATHRLICLSIFSNRALERLEHARRDQADRFRAGTLPNWPYCEAYVPMEGRRQGLKLAELSDYGDVEQYDWWPPHPEKDLPALEGHAFVHPVLDRSRFLASIVKYPDVRGLFLPNSLFHRRLRRLGLRDYLAQVVNGRFAALAGTTLRERLRRRA